MINGGLVQFSGKRVLLLQGPVGPFFARLGKDLRSLNALVFKINFNAGDCFFYPRGFKYQGSMQAWPEEFEEQVLRHAIDVVFLFGDQRAIHVQARAIAERLGLEVGVFEEGYLRPDHITFERFGVNQRSRLSRSPADYKTKVPFAPKTLPVGNAYWHMVWYAFLYYLVGSLGKPWFRFYKHHRPLSLWEAFPWIRAVWRKQWYRLMEWGINARLCGPEKGNFFLVPLQVFNDSQVTSQSDFYTVERFVEHVLRSFAEHAPKNTLLVIKHHPMDRGYADYGKVIQVLTDKLGLRRRVLYIHDQRLPSLLDCARGVVVINSTVGLSALHHGAPTKVCGEALYALSGLTFSDSLDKFWREAILFKPDKELFENFRSHLIHKTQLNGSFYKKLPGRASEFYTGLEWRSLPRRIDSMASLVDLPGLSPINIPRQAQIHPSDSPHLAVAVPTVLESEPSESLKRDSA